jgi:sugar phosphate isomerase/epimerase
MHDTEDNRVSLTASTPSLTSSPWGFRFTPLEEQCRWLHAHGFAWVCGQFADFPGALPMTSDAAAMERVRDLTRGFGLQYASCNANGDFMVREGLEEQVRLAGHEIDLAAILKPEVIIVFAGWQDRADEAVYDQVTGALRQVARHAARYGLTVALENHGGLTRTAAQCNRLLKAVGEPNIGLNYDPANFAMYGEDPLRALDALEVPVVFTHLKSLKPLDGKKVYCRLREGEIDYLPILRRLRRDYPGSYALEYEDPADVFAGTADDLETLTGWFDGLKTKER